MGATALIPISPTTIRLLAGLAVVAAVGGTWLYITSLNTKIASLNQTIEYEKDKYRLLAREFTQATQAKSVLDSQLKEAEVNRQALVKSYDARLKQSRRSAPAPSATCPQVIEWAIERKGDLAWEK